MKKLKGVGVAVVFLVGCAVGGGSSRFVVPLASAQQAATLTRWEYLCFEEHGDTDVQAKAQKAGTQGWEMAAVQSEGVYSTWCFKRPKL